MVIYQKHGSVPVYAIATAGYTLLSSDPVRALWRPDYCITTREEDRPYTGFETRGFDVRNGNILR